MSERWHIPNEYLSKISLNEAKFVFEHAEKKLKDVVYTNILIVNRTTTLVTVSVGLLVGLIGFSINHWITMRQFDELFTISVFTELYLFVICLILKDNIQAQEYYVIGANPSLFFTDNLYNSQIDNMQIADPEKEQRLIYMYINEIENYQFRIEKNIETNENRWRLFNTSLKALVYLPVYIIVMYFILTLLH